MSFAAQKEEEGHRIASVLKRYKADIDRPIAAILSLNTIANTMGAAAVGAQAAQVFGSYVVGYVSAGLTVGILIFSEINILMQIPFPLKTQSFEQLPGRFI